MFDFLKLIDFKLFIFSFAIGLFCVYITANPNKVIYVYPTPDNTEQYLFKDRTDNCFKYQAQEVSCGSAKDVQSIPAQK